MGLVEVIKPLQSYQLCIGAILLVLGDYLIEEWTY